MTENEERSAVVAEARSWIGTPYHHRAMIRGVGVDCATLIVAAFHGAGLIDKPELPPYSPQWHLNKDAQKYIGVILRHAIEVEVEPRPGDVVLWRIGRVFSHGAIVVSWPIIVHAVVGQGCYEDDALAASYLASERDGSPRPRKLFSYWS